MIQERLADEKLHKSERGFKSSKCETESMYDAVNTFKNEGAQAEGTRVSVGTITLGHDAISAAAKFRQDDIDAYHSARTRLQVRRADYAFLCILVCVSF